MMDLLEKGIPKLVLGNIQVVAMGNILGGATCSTGGCKSIMF
jgi:hypothetical protein